METAQRWLILSQYYPPEIGAAQIRLRALARELRRSGSEVAVLTAMPNYPTGKIFPGYEKRWRYEEEMEGIRVRRTWVYAANSKSAPARLANYLSFTMTALWAALSGPRPDVIFVESQPLTLGLIVLLMKWLRGVPFIYNVPDLQMEAARQMGFISSRWFLGAAYWLENFLIRHSWKMSTVTRRFIRHYERRGVPCDQITFLPNGADAELLKPQPPCRDLIQRWNLEGKKVFVYAGTQAHIHGVETLIEAAARLRQRQDLAILLVGDGPEQPRLRQMSESRGLTNVIFDHSCPYEELGRVYSIAYSSVATVRNLEVIHHMRVAKIFSSLSCGVPVVYAGRGETADLISSHGCGIVVPPEDPDALAAAMESLAEARAERDSMGKAGRNLVESEYNWTTIVQAWLRELAGSNENVGAELARERS